MSHEADIQVLKPYLSENKSGCRADGRPEGYMLPTMTEPGYLCSVCMALAAVSGSKPKALNGDDGIVMMNHEDTIDGNRHLLCVEHQPENIVVFNPETGTCRDRTGENVWTET